MARTTTVAAGAAATGLVGVLLGLSVLGAAGQEEDEEDAAPVGFATVLAPHRVPPEYVPWIERAGEQCDEVSAPLIAAQIEAESGWDPTATSSADAQGLSQFLPGTWETWGVDAGGQDGGDEPDGVADPFTPADAILTQARYNCWLAEEVARLGLSGDPTRLMLAAYNAGPGAVAEFGGVPPYPETQDYVVRITESISDYTGIDGSLAGGGEGTGDGADADEFGARVVAHAEQWLGTPYSWGGGGPEGPGRGFAQGADTVGFDCSSLVQYAVYHASDGATLLPRTSQAQVTAGEPVAPDDLRPGDVIGFDLRGSYDHIGIYVGDGQLLHAPRTGDVVKVSPLDDPAFRDRPQKARRFG